jgi:hypothetical protein
MASTDERYVTTQAIRGAVSGHDEMVLDRLGIRWRDGRPHVACPYPDHKDTDPSWRWDAGKRRAFCTCNEPGKADGIFDVAMKMRGIDFAAAKLLVDELLGRSDLIKTGGGGQKFDATSLLNPPASERDDSLVGRYLAGRLGLADPGTILLPGTPITGWKALGYYDPPGAKGGKPVLVASPPCAVFGTLATDGRQHAHRIYLSADGTGKVALGAVANGKDRDPKKSARVPPGAPSTAGCAVIWGEPDIEHMFIAEGIENAAVAAVMLRGRIERGEVAVAAAISAGGVEAFKPWPAMRHLTVIADRDEAKSGAGFKRGERAARNLALRLHQAAKQDGTAPIEVLLVLPGEPGTATDVLDIYRERGPAAVEALLAAATPITPSDDEFADFANSAAQQDEIARVTEAYPLPSSTSHRLEYRHTSLGEVWVHRFDRRKKNEETGEYYENWQPISTPFTIRALMRLVDADNGHAMRVAIADDNGTAAIVDFDRGDLSRLAASEIRARLLHAGLRVTSSGEAAIVGILKETRAGHEIAAFSRSGWHHPADEWCFVAPTGGVIGTAPTGGHIELFGRLASAQAGTFDGWREAVQAAVRAHGCPHWKIGIATGFAGPIVDLLGIETHGINLSGPTSLGKTTAQRLAVSAWSSPKPGAGLLQSMRTTENAIEILARQSYGTILALDELAHVAGRVIGRIIYLLAGNTGKARMTAGGVLRPLVTWSTFVLTSGEQTLEQKIRGDDGQWSSGMAVRFSNIDVSGVDPKVDAKTLTEIDAIFRHHGHAGPAFVERMIAQGWHHDPRPLLQLISNETRRLAGADADSARVRAARPLAIVAVAGAAAVAFDIVPKELDIGTATDWAWSQFEGSREAEALDSEQRAIDNIRLWSAERWDSSIKRIEPLSRFNGRDAVAWYDNTTIYVPTARIAEAAGNVLNAQALGILLDKQKLLATRRDERRIALQWVPGVGPVQAYALKRSEFHEDPPPPPSGGYPHDC